MADSLLILSLNESGAFGHYAPVAHEIGLSVVCLKNDFEATNAVARTHCDQVFITDDQTMMDPPSALKFLRSQYPCEFIRGVILHERTAFLYDHFCDQLNVGARVPRAALLRCAVKSAMRHRLNELTQYPVSYTVLQNENAALTQTTFPGFLKPINGSASMFVHKVRNQDELNQFHTAFIQENRSRLAQASNSLQMQIDGEDYDVMTDFMVEQCLEGKELSAEGYVWQGKTQILSISEKLAFEGGRGGWESAIITPPLTLTKDQLQEINECLLSSLRAIDYDNNTFHVELFITPNGPRIIEMNPRNGGSAITDRVRLFRGIHQKRACVEMAIGTFNPPTHLEERPYIYTNVFYPHRAGTITAVKGLEALEAIPEVREIKIHYDVGRVIPEVEREIYLAEVLMQSEDPKVLQKLSPTIQKTLQFIIE